ncbi:MAG: hypothetical protein OEV94_00395 [Deltaproteobacteria bacterium]|nr:hypothetical protein [Deltaproteobacteria bacterium]
MLDINFDLISLDDADREELARQAALLSRRRQLPPVPPSRHGRFAVVNPDAGSSLHQIPYDLRKPLRRVMVPVMEAGRNLSADAVAERVLAETGEPLHGLLIELHNDFPALDDFLNLLPMVAERQPGCLFYLHGDGPRINALIRRLVEGNAPGRPKAALGFPLDPAWIPLETPDQLGPVFASPPRYPTFPGQTFSLIQVRGENGQVHTITPANARKFVPMYGMNNLEELDLPEVQREALQALEIPLQRVVSVRMAAPPPRNLAGVVMGGMAVGAPRFAEKGLTEHDIPLERLTALVRKRQVHQPESIPLARCRSLRMLCRDGSLTLVWRPAADYLPLQDLERLRLTWGEGEAARSLAFRQVVVTEPAQPHPARIQGAIRQGFLETLYSMNLVHTIKLKKYARNLKIACLGPMAAQTLKMILPLGLKPYLPPTGFYFLTDQMEEMANYQTFQRRVEELYTQLIRQLGELFARHPDNPFDPAGVNHRMPHLLDWVEGQAPAFSALNREMLDNLYNEIRSFLDYCETTYTHADPRMGDGEDLLNRLDLCHSSLLLTRQLANLVSGRYGRFFQEGEYPDFVFFGTGVEMKVNGQSWFLPGMALDNMFPPGAVGQQFSRGDYGFSLFVEDQMAIVESLRRQEMDFQMSQKSVDQYFQQRREEARGRLNELIHAAQPEHQENSAQWTANYQRMEQTHRREEQRVKEDLEKVRHALAQAESAYFDVLAEVHRYLEAETHHLDADELLAGTDYMDNLDKRLSHHGEKLAERLFEAQTEALEQIGQETAARREELTHFLEAFAEAQKALFPFFKADHARQEQALLADSMGGLLARLTQLAQLPNAQLEQAANDIQHRRQDVQREMNRLNNHLDQVTAKSQQAMMNVGEKMDRVRQRLEPITVYKGGGMLPEDMAGEMRRRRGEAADLLKEVAATAKESHEALANALKALYQNQREKNRLLYQTANELAMVKMAAEGNRPRTVTAPLVPLPAPTVVKGQDQAGENLSKARTRLNTLGENISRPWEDPPSTARLVRAAQETHAFQEEFLKFMRAVREKRRLQQGALALAGRLEKLRADQAALPRLIRERMIPAYQRLCHRFFIPQAEERMTHFTLAGEFLSQAMKLNYPEFQKAFLDRAVFRRFHRAQFKRGAQYGLDPDHPLFLRLRNIPPALALFFRAAKLSLEDPQGKTGQVITDKLPMAHPDEILAWVEQQSKAKQDQRYGYLVLPPSLSLPQALEIILRKERIMKGLPRLVVMYVSAFNHQVLQENQELRDKYFQAVHHNVIVNILGPGMVNNPAAIGQVLIANTLGSAFDLERVQQPEELLRGTVGGMAPA